MLHTDYKKMENQRFGDERALYESHGVWLKNCAFDGEEDGESALKESSDILVQDTFCNLRYPFWHDDRLTIEHCEMTPLCRAALWYSNDVTIKSSKLHGIKALRECNRVTMEGCDVLSAEFGWSVSDVTMKDCTAEGEYFMMRVKNFSFNNVRFQGKYSFQYSENGLLENCELNTKDAFWHAKNLTVKNCTVRGEYLAWYSENLTMIDCKIIGTQPFCYCKNLKLINCEMIDTDLAFEKSDVEATITTPVISIKNVASGTIRVPSVGELLQTDKCAMGQIILTNG
ncbi:MAG: DUF3737 family protein [Clostridia bacterium]|nr:DUF3737 family protein [Clostridia bacterium]